MKWVNFSKYTGDDFGIDASIRQVDSAQYEQRQSDFDFDFNLLHWSIGATPTDNAASEICAISWVEIAPCSESMNSQS